MQLIDSHCHLDFAIFDDDRSELLALCRQQHINGFVIPGVSAVDWPRLMALVDETPGMFGALGLHPMFMGQHQQSDLLLLERLLADWHAVAVGEIGLDFYHGDDDKEGQLALFEAQLCLAKRFNLPVILHVRKAHDQALAILRRVRPCGGVVHAFSGSEQQAHQYIGLGFMLGVGGAITHSRASRLRRTLSALPLQALVLESDAPDMSPAGAVGERNTPLCLSAVVGVLSTLHSLTVEQIVWQTTENVVQVLRLPLKNINTP